MSDYNQEVVTPTSIVHMAATTLTIFYHVMTILLHPVTIGYIQGEFLTFFVVYGVIHTYN